MDALDEFPLGITQSPLTLVGFCGLELSRPVHMRVWQAFTSNRGIDRHALHFINMPPVEQLNFPPSKVKKSSYELYIPKGILKKNWMHKHQNIIPSVIILFVELNWNEQEIVNRTRHCAQQVDILKRALIGRNTKITVVLLQSEENCGDTESITNFCTECEISHRSVFVIALKDQLLPSVVRLEATLHELSQNYYHILIKNVRSHKEALNKSSHILLMIRHMFKIGYFNEMKNDLHSAQKSYQAAYSLILETKLNEFNISEFRTVAGFINYKICRLGFKLNLPREAISHFKKHMDNFKSKTGVPELGWEHAAWQCTQATMFARLFLDAYKNGQQAIQTQHPGIYFQLAADYAISRRKLAEEQCSQIQSYPDPDPLAETSEFFGQRPWRPGKLEPVDLQREKEGIEAMQYRERTKTKHSDLIINLQQLAVQQFETFKSPRMMNQVLVQMAEELMIDQKYKKAMSLLIPVADAYRKEQWLSLTTSTLLRAVKCAFLTSDIATYIRLCLDLTSPKSECTRVDKLRIEQNFWLVLDLKPPLPEPSLTGKNERASVGLATKNWKEKLENFHKLTTVCLPNKTLIDISPCGAKKVKIGEPSMVALEINNWANQTVKLENISSQYNRPGYDTQKKDTQEVTIEAGSASIIEFPINPKSKDVDEELRLVSTEFTLSNAPGFVFRKIFDDKEGDSCNSIKFIPRDSNIEIKFECIPPLLIGEWFDFPIRLESKENTKTCNLQVLCWLRDGGDPLISDTTCLNTLPGYPTTPTTPGGSQSLEMAKSSASVCDIDSGSSQLLRFYLRASTLGTRAVVCQLRYSIQLRGESCVCSSQQVFEVRVVPPFSFSYHLFNQMLEETKQVSTDQHFLIVPKVTCISTHGLTLINTRMEARPPLQVVKEQQPCEEMTELREGFLFEENFTAVVPHRNLFTQYETETVHLGKLHLYWRRWGHEVVNETIFELSNVTVGKSFMSLECVLPPFGVLRTPSSINFELTNKTNEVQEYALTMEPSDAFMFSGPKHLRLKVFPRDTCRVHYMLYPLLVGSLILPKLKILPITSGGVASLDKCGAIEEIMARTLPDHFLVLPLVKSEDLQSLDLDYFELKEPTVIANLPVAGPGNKLQLNS